MKILKRELIRKSEESAVLGGTFSFKELMYTAGSKAAEIICQKVNVEGKKIGVVCGNGNNGGDGFVIANHLYGNGADVTVITPIGAPATENALFYYNELQFIKKSNHFNGDENYDIIVDSIFGIGFNRAPNKEISDLLEKINQHKALKFAVDIPSGVDCDSGEVYTSAIMADYTITFISLKPCFVLPNGSDYCGEVTVADIGVKPVDYSFLTIEEPVFKKRLHNSHKGTYGTALLICGSYGMAGAAILAAKGALRSGLGIAKCVLCDSIYSAFTSSLPEAVCVPLKQTEKGTFCHKNTNIRQLTENCDALLFGCGVGKSEDITLILKDVLNNNILPTVIDADGINALCGCIDILKESKTPVIITPHPGEMARLCGKTVKEIESDRINVAKEFAEEYGCVLVLKGANTVVATPNGEIFFNITGNSGMAKGGSGDVLSGIIVSFLAQGYSLEKSAKNAVYIHGKAGDMATQQRNERSVLPSDIIENL